MKSEVKFRLTRAHDAPPSHEVEEAVEFGLQDTKGAVVPGTRAEGEFLFDFVLTVRDGRDAIHPGFGGRFASGRRMTDLCTCRGARGHAGFGSIG